MAEVREQTPVSTVSSGENSHRNASIPSHTEMDGPQHSGTEEDLSREQRDSVSVDETRPRGVCYMYARILARFWYVIIFLVFMTVVAFTALPLTLYKLPDFLDPIKGFNARGTVLSARLLSLQNLNANFDDFLVVSPPEAGSSQFRASQSMMREAQPSRLARTSRQAGLVADSGIWFCFQLWELYPEKAWSTLVFEGVDGRNMLTTKAIKSVCREEERLVTSHPSYNDYCSCQPTGANNNCPSTWSVGNYIALLVNKTTCEEIVDEDVNKTTDLLIRCAPLFHNIEPPDVRKQTLPVECKQHNYAIFSILRYLLPTEYSNSINENNNPMISIVSVRLPITDIEALKKIFQESIERKPDTDGITKLKAVEFNIKYNLFAETILSDSIYMIIAAAVIFLMIWVYTGSSLVTLAALLNMVFSFALAYFFFTVAYFRPFFPFVNIITGILLLGVGADDTFVYMDLWNKCRAEFGDRDFPRLVHETLRHASVTMFVTSLTTAAALFATVISNIIVVRCFAIFAGTAIIMNLVLTLTLLPAVIVMQHKLTVWCCSKNTRRESKSKCSCLTRLFAPLKIFHETFIPFLVLKLRYILIVLFLLMMTGGAVVVFYYPGLQLPSSGDFQVFMDSNHFEQYDLVYKNRFFDDSQNVIGSIIWGVQAVDNGDTWDPDDYGELLLNDSFQFFSPEDQTWLLDFCRDIRNQSFYKSDGESGCFMEDFIGHMQQKACINDYGQDLYPCCNNSVFPYETSLFKACLGKFANQFLLRGVFFRKNDSEPAVIKFDFVTHFRDSFRFSDNDELWRNINTWTEETLRSAPDSLKHGWFSSASFYELTFYDLQQNLAYGTRISVLITLAIATGILFLTIQNILLTIWAMLTITSAVFVTVASIVLLGWELNVVEAAIITLSVGLSVDFTIHYGVAYKLSPSRDRRGRTQFSLKTMTPSISIAALSTFVAGALVLPSTLLSYYQFGVFLMLVMAISWSHGTFFFQSLCMAFGPQEKCGDTPCLPCCECCRVGNKIEPAPIRVSPSRPERANTLEVHDNPSTANVYADEGIQTVSNGQLNAAFENS